MTAPADSRLELRLLGRFEVRRAGEAVELPPSRKARALLAYLAATGRSHDRGHLSALLWDERDDARAALRWALTRLRPVLGEGEGKGKGKIRLVAERDLIKLEASAAAIDLAEVRAALAGGIDQAPTEVLARAAGRFRGELLEGLDLTDCYGFHAWCLAEREAARALRTSILSTLVDRLGDDPAQALPFARARLDLDPLAGGAQAAVIRLLGALGREREAEELYKSLKQMVQARLGERASPELERARAALRSVPGATGGAAAGAPAPGVAPPPATAEPLARLARTPFVGRSDELATSTAALDAALSGAGLFVEISGEAGIGKSRLVEEIVHQARLRGARALVGRCLEGDASPAFLPFLDSLEKALEKEIHLERLVGEDAVLATRLFPRLAARLRLPAPPAMDATSERYLVFQAVAILLERIAAPAGAVLVIEDLHWIDQPSLALLRYLAARLDGTRLLVVATYRDEDLEPRKQDALVDLRRQGGTRVPLRGLAPGEVNALVDAFGGRDVPVALRARLAAVTNGHPLFLQEMLKHLAEENAGKAPEASALDPGALDELSVPDGVRQVIERRLARLSERARRLLAMVSPMIGPFRWELVQAVAGAPRQEDDLLDALEEVLAAQLLEERVVAGAATYELSHQLVAQTLHDALPAPRRTRLHRQIGEAIEQLHPADLEEHLPALAHHFWMAASDDASKQKAADYALRAAARAAALLAFEEAARHYERAAALLPGEATARLADIHRRRGHALAVVSAWDDACEAYEQALALGPADAHEWRAEVLIELGTASLWAMNMPAVYTRAREADRLVRSLGREDLTLGIGGLLGQCQAADGELSPAIAKYAEIRAMRGARHVPSMSLAPLTLYWNGHIADSIAWAHENLAAARAAGDIVSLLVSLPPLGMALAASGRYRDAAAAFAEARGIGERHRATSLLARAISMSTGMHLDLGDVDTAEDLAAEARELGRTSGWAPGEVSASIDLIVCRLRRGDVGAAATMWEAASARAAEISRRKPGGAGFHDWLWTLRLAWARAEVGAARGDEDEVERWSAETLSRAAGTRPKYEAGALITRATFRARPAASKSHRRDALTDLDRALTIARASGDPALVRKALAARLALEGSDALAQEARAIEDQIAAARTSQT